MTEVKSSEISNFSPSAYEKTKRRNKLMIRFDCNCRVPASVVSSFSFLCLVSSKFLIYYSILLSQNISLSPYLFTMLRFDFVAARLSNCCHTMEMEHFRKKKFS